MGCSLTLFAAAGFDSAKLDGCTVVGTNIETAGLNSKGWALADSIVVLTELLVS